MKNEELSVSNAKEVLTEVLRVLSEEEGFVWLIALSRMLRHRSPWVPPFWKILNPLKVKTSKAFVQALRRAKCLVTPAVEKALAQLPINFMPNRAPIILVRVAPADFGLGDGNKAHLHQIVSRFGLAPCSLVVCCQFALQYRTLYRNKKDTGQLDILATEDGTPIHIFLWEGNLAMRTLHDDDLKADLPRIYVLR